YWLSFAVVIVVQVVKSNACQILQIELNLPDAERSGALARSDQHFLVKNRPLLTPASAGFEKNHETRSVHVTTTAMDKIRSNSTAPLSQRIWRSGSAAR